MDSVRRLILAFLFVLLTAAGVEAACVGGGAAWTCDATSSHLDIQAAMDAADGSVVTTTPGTYVNFTGNLNFRVSKGSTVICSSPPNCIWNEGSSPFATMESYPDGTVSTKLYRISGWTMNQVDNGWPVVYWNFNGGSDSRGGTFTQFRFDHNTVNAGASTTYIALKGIGNPAHGSYLYGSIDQNTFSNTKDVCPPTGNGPAPGIWLFGATDFNPVASTSGTISNMYVEDNVFSWSVSCSGGNGVIDMWGGSSVVGRFNTVTGATFFQTHGVTHSGGPQNIEALGNLTQQTASSGYPDGHWSFHNQGSG